MENQQLIYEAVFKLLDNITDIVYVLEKDKNTGKFLKIYTNKRLLEITDLEYKNIIGKPHNEFLPAEIANFCDKSNEIIENTKKPFSAKKEFEFNGKKLYFEFTKIPIFDKEGNIIAIAGWAKDITELVLANKKEKNLNRKLINLLEKDQTTGLLNKNALEKIIRNFSRKNKNFSLIVFDIDNFKFINQIYGFKLGDFVLQTVAKNIKKLAKSYLEKPIVARIGNDQIAIFFDCVNLNFASNIAKEIKEKLESIKINLKGSEISLTFTVAVYCQCINKERKPPQYILSDLEITLLRAKEKGKSEIIIYNEKLDSKDRFKSFFEEKKLILDAIREKRFVPFLQPIYDIKENKVFAYEILVRIKNGKDLFISPSEFIDTAIKSGLISQIDKILLEKLIDLTKQTNKKLFFNISALSLEKNFEFIKSMFNNNQNIIFEITEQVAVNNIIIIEKLNKENGIKFAIDDFGTGYASLKFVVELSILKVVEYLKIDGSLIKEINKNESDRKIVSTIVKLAKDLNLKTIAEFVENEEIVKEIKELDIDFAQGYYYTPPRIYLEFLDEAV